MNDDFLNLKLINFKPSYNCPEKKRKKNEPVLLSFLFVKQYRMIF